MPEVLDAVTHEDPATSAPSTLEVRNLSVAVRQRTILRDVNLRIPPRQVFGLIGPSGAGKSTLLKCLNRLTELTPALRVTGDVLLNGQSIYAPSVRPDDLRTKVGMLFQQPVVFPKSIYQNVIFGVRHVSAIPRRRWPQVAEAALREAALWEEVRDRLSEPAAKLSVGQQQRLCLARALACGPEVILMDEPTSALDPRSTRQIEELITRLKARHTVVLVTHNLAQARRMADYLACFSVTAGVGGVLATGCCDGLLNHPASLPLREYLDQAP